MPIRIVSDPSEAAANTEPRLARDAGTAVAVIFPSRDFRGLKNVVERMRSVNDWIRISTCAGGGGGGGGSAGMQSGGSVDFDGAAYLELLVSRPELVTIKTTYPRLGVPTTAPPEGDAQLEGDAPTGAAGSDDGEQRACALVDAKKLVRVLSSLSSSDLKIQNAIVCVVPGQMVILKIYLQDGNAQSFLIYYLPVGVEEKL